VARRIILCDGADLARLWGHIGAADGEELTWVPREDAPRARPPGFRSLQGGLNAEAVGRLGPETGDEFALVTEDLPFARAAVAAIGAAAPGAPILLLSDRVDADELPDHACLLRTGLRSLIRDDIDEEFAQASPLSCTLAMISFTRSCSSSSISSLYARCVASLVVKSASCVLNQLLIHCLLESCKYVLNFNIACFKRGTIYNKIG
jgi:hypothetical protein